MRWWRHGIWIGAVAAMGTLVIVAIHDSDASKILATVFGFGVSLIGLAVNLWRNTAQGAETDGAPGPSRERLEQWAERLSAAVDEQWRAEWRLRRLQDPHHMFTPQQPDWNWDNPEVREDFLTTLRFWGDRGIDGFRVDVASGLAKDMSEPYPTWEDVRGGVPFVDAATRTFPDGQHPLFDRDELDAIYASWRQVFNTYDPPLFAVAEAWVAPHRQGRYANSEGLGQSFNFDLLAAGWDRDAFESIIRTNLQLAEAHDTTSTWVFSNHDVVRHATRFAVTGPMGILGRVSRPRDHEAAALGADRARAATLLALALPGSSYLYQGEELGLPEVFDIPAELAQDPSAIIENGIAVAGRDGCRVPLPWTKGGTFFGFSDRATHPPQPEWFGAYSVEAESADDQSTLTLYRRALHLRRSLQTEERLEWLDHGGVDVLAFTRPNGWTSITNFGTSPVPLPSGSVVIRTDHKPAGVPLDPNATAWLTRN
jgi:alpha-glucosidase